MTTTKAQDIVEIFESFDGPVTLHEITKAALEKGVWSKRHQDKMVFRALCKEVRDTLNKAQSADLLPAGIARVQIVRDEEGNATKVNLWVQRRIWDVSDGRNYIRRRVRALRDDYKRIEAMVLHCEKKWPGEDWWSLVPVEWKD